MSLTIAQQKKHLLLLNKLHRNALKAELIPAPSKLSDDKVEKLFNEFFKKKENYYIPKVSSTILKIDEEEFKKLYKEPKQKKEVKSMKQEEPKEKIDNEKIKQINKQSNEITPRNLAGTEKGTLYLSKKLKDMYNGLNETEKKFINNNSTLKRNIDIVIDNVFKDNDSKIKELTNTIQSLTNKIENLKSLIENNKKLKTKKALEKGKERNLILEKDIQELKDDIVYKEKIMNKLIEKNKEIEINKNNISKLFDVLKLTLI